MALIYSCSYWTAEIWRFIGFIVSVVDFTHASNYKVFLTLNFPDDDILYQYNLFSTVWLIDNFWVAKFSKMSAVRGFKTIFLIMKWLLLFTGLEYWTRLLDWVIFIPRTVASLPSILELHAIHAGYDFIATSASQNPTRSSMISYSYSYITVHNFIIVLV